MAVEETPIKHSRILLNLSISTSHYTVTNYAAVSIQVPNRVGNIDETDGSRIEMHYRPFANRPADSQRD